MHSEWRSHRTMRITSSIILIAVLILATSGQMATASIDDDPGTISRVRFEGYLKAKGADKWLVGEHSVIIAPSTVVIEKRGAAEVGAWLVVSGEAHPDGSLLAETIEVFRPAGQYSATSEITGALTKIIDPNHWMVSDVLIVIGPSTYIEGDPTLGSLVWVLAEQTGNDPMAIVIRKLATSPEQLSVDFEGMANAIEDSSWLVGDQRVLVDAETLIIGEPGLGKNVEVKAIQRGDGVLKATLLRVMETGTEVSIAALVASISAADDGTSVWDMVAFPSIAWADPIPLTLLVHGNTLVDESRAVAQPGQWAEVVALPLSADAYQADRIRLEQPVSVVIATDLDRRSVQPDGSGWWDAGGRPVWISGAALPEVSNSISSRTLSGLLLGNGVIWVPGPGTSVAADFQ